MHKALEALNDEINRLTLELRQLTKAREILANVPRYNRYDGRHYRGPHSAEARAKISAAQRAAWARGRVPHKKA